MTREEIEQINAIEPYCFETDREEEWYKVGLIKGLETADTNPISPWVSVHSSKPSDYKELHRTFNGILIRDELRTVPVIARAVNGDNVIHIMAYMYLNRDTNLWEWVSLNKPIGKVYSITHWMPIPKLQEDKL